MSQWVVHRDPRFFDRAGGVPPGALDGRSCQKTLPKFAYFPFGGGPRLCIGNTFAMMEMVLVLATIAQQFRFALEPGADRDAAADVHAATGAGCAWDDRAGAGQRAFSLAPGSQNRGGRHACKR